MRDREPSKRPVGAKIVYWHRELPPLDADVIGEHVLEATSCRVPGTIPHPPDTERQVRPQHDDWIACRAARRPDGI